MKKFNLKKFIIPCLLAVVVLYGISMQNPCSADENAKYNSAKQNADVYEDLELYVVHTRRKIKDNWYPPVTSFEKTATVDVSINTKGELVNCSIVQSSSDEDFDKSLIEAVKKSNFSPLPKGFRGDHVDLLLDFGMQRRSISK